MPNALRPLKEVFLGALAVAPTERAAWLERECADNAQLRRQVELMLAAHVHPQTLIDHLAPPAEPPGRVAIEDFTAAKIEHSGAIIGPYKLLEQIGEGGFGVVFMAEQLQPVRRRVALKILKPGMDSRHVVARFEAERQALAIMDHPNIARVYDGGATPSGRPYFVMELVRGVPITEFCDQNHLTPRQRLELFVPVCQAVQHAHQKGIIHRDLKPSNILISRHDTTPVVKVIDFGVAKALGQSLTDKTLFTGIAQMIGTPLYMSPEQAGMSDLDVDTRSDIYALGVLLYELLTGSTPFRKERFQQATYDEVRRIIREEEPPKPSTRLSQAIETLVSISAQRQTEPAKLTKLVRGELDWIVMKALEKDRNRRYEAANGLARDIERYLHDEPVLACPPSMGYRVRKFVRRNRTAAGIAVVALCALVLLGAAAGWMIRDRDSRRVQLAAQLDLILNEVKQHEAEQKWPEALAEARRAEALVNGAGGDAALEAHVLRVLSDLKLVDRLEAIRLERERPYKTEPFTAWADRAYAVAFSGAGLDLDQVPPEVASERIRERGPVALALVTALDDWAFCRNMQKNATGAEVLRTLAQRIDPDPWRGQLREAMARKDAQTIEALAAAPDLTRQPPAALYLLFLALYVVEKPDQALTVLRKANWQYPGDFWIAYWLGYRLRELGPAHKDEAAIYCRTAVALRPHSSWAWHQVGYTLENQEQWEKALAVHRRVATLDPTSVWAHLDIGRMLEKLDRRDEAIPSYWKALECNPKHDRTRRQLQDAIYDQKDREKIIVFFKRVSASDPRIALASWYLGCALWWSDKEVESLPLFEKAVALDPSCADFHQSLASNLRWLGRVDEAIRSFEKALELGQRDDWLHYDYGRALRQKGRLADAIRSWKTSLEMNPNRIQSLRALSWHLATAADPALRDPTAAVGHALKVVKLEPKVANHWSKLGVAQFRSGDLKAAIETLESADAMYPIGDHTHRFFLAMAYWQNGEKDKARTAYEQGVRWMQWTQWTQWTQKNRPANEDLRRFRAEAEAVLKIENK